MFDGVRSRHIYLSILGQVYDVTKGRRHYGETGRVLCDTPSLCCKEQCWTDRCAWTMPPFWTACAGLRLLVRWMVHSASLGGHYMDETVAGPEGGYKAFAGVDASKAFLTGLRCPMRMQYMLCDARPVYLPAVNRFAECHGLLQLLSGDQQIQM